MSYSVGANVEVITTTYIGRWIYPGERGVVVREPAPSLGLEVYVVRLEDGEDCIFTSAEIRELEPA